MNENKLKHLEFIQNVITRMNTNSFLVKGWSVTLLAAIFALAAKESNQAFAIVVYLPIGVFWGLDAFFLSQEKQYRGHYKNVTGMKEEDIDFNMDASECNVHGNDWWSCLRSKTIASFHGTLFVVTLLVMFVIPRLGNCH